VHVKLGNREVSEVEKSQIKNIIGRRGNLLIQTIEAQAPTQPELSAAMDNITVLTGVVRSGQTVMHEGNLLYMGDINPGGSIVSTGDIYIMGCLRGMAHAGVNGNVHSIIAASYLRPTQLRIADVISRPPDEWGIEEAHMEFAYIHNGKMEIDRIAHLSRLRSRA
jgi:septum site-determining protein MinC